MRLAAPPHMTCKHITDRITIRKYQFTALHLDKTSFWLRVGDYLNSASPVTTGGVQRHTELELFSRLGFKPQLPHCSHKGAVGHRRIFGAPDMCGARIKLPGELRRPVCKPIEPQMIRDW